MADQPIAVRARVTGLVQGVNFRAWTQAEARRLGLSGWTRNEDDGSVTVVAAGPRQTVDEMIELLHRGPRIARVTGVSVAPADATDIPPGFHILR
jgi:acylphosphatase